MQQTKKIKLNACQCIRTAAQCGCAVAPHSPARCMSLPLPLPRGVARSDCHTLTLSGGVCSDVHTTAATAHPEHSLSFRLPDNVGVLPFCQPILAFAPAFAHEVRTSASAFLRRLLCSSEVFAWGVPFSLPSFVVYNIYAYIYIYIYVYIYIYILTLLTNSH